MYFVLQEHNTGEYQNMILVTKLTTRCFPLLFILLARHEGIMHLHNLSLNKVLNKYYFFPRKILVFVPKRKYN